MSHGLDLSVIIPAFEEGQLLSTLLPELQQVLAGLELASEVLIVTLDRDPLTTAAAERAGARLIAPATDGYGAALSAGWDAARGDYILTMDADVARAPTFVRTLWQVREQAEITIASRYVPGGSAQMPALRTRASRVLNAFFRRGLSVPIQDLSSGFRLYHAATLRHAKFPADRSATAQSGVHAGPAGAGPSGSDATGFDILQQVLVRAFAEGWKVQEVPFAYEPHPNGSSNRRGPGLAGSYLKTFWSLWKHRNSILAADYDDRAHDSVIWLQRYWQRSRHKHVTDLIAGQGAVLDVGCGSSRIIGALPKGSVAMDILRRKLRYARKFGRPVVHASGFQLPVRDESFPCVLCSQVIEHVPKESPILDELCRALAPGGRLVLGTPDYANWQWVWMEKAYGLAAPGGYADEHIAHYTYAELMDIFTKRGFTFEEHRYIMRGELIMAFRKNKR